MALLLTFALPAGIVLCLVLLVVAVVGSFRTSEVERAQREHPGDRREEPAARQDLG